VEKKLEGSELHPLLLLLLLINVVKAGWKQGKPVGNKVGNMTREVLNMRRRGKIM
jgi:hypothetical protein